ncbi:hypothetical protein FF011L_44580 [Roseimaritima multifibrata]|uniref:Uncharacterized protein n=1 Tax=Roseimaritima multifibrata TaxID=1930274 RepID=A0A517MLA7_9BACT|nr:hypothetical protein FF011L_44580 [Roseimaritima multifibrata]
MDSPELPTIPLWVMSFCCIAPFLALILFACAQFMGVTVSTSPVFCLSLLCGETTRRLLGGRGLTLNVNLPRLTKRN